MITLNGQAILYQEYTRACMSKFCPLPFIHMSSTNDGNYRVCCYSEETAILKDDGTPYNMRKDSIVDVWQSNFYKTLRQDLLTDVENPACKTCWKHEADGVFSKRQQSIQELKGFYTEGTVEEVPTMLDIKVGSLCNLKCITCYPGASSQHQTEVEQWRAAGETPPALIQMFDERLKKLNISIDDYNPKNIDVQSVIKNLEPSLAKAKELSLVGGEPLVNPVALELIQHCVEKGYAENMMLTVITNLTTLNPKMLSNFSKFKHPMIMVSYDHVDPDKFNYIRYPADYDHFFNNLKTLLANDKIEVKLSTTWSIFNIFDLPEIFDFWEQLSVDYKKRFIINFQFVMYPNYFSIQYLGKEQKANVSKMVEDYLSKTVDYKIFRENPDMLELVKSVDRYMNSQTEDFDSVVAERARVLKLYDSTRKTDYFKFFNKLG